MSQRPRLKIAQKRRRLVVEQLEKRDLLARIVGDGNPAEVFTTTEFPHSAVVQLALHYDRDGDGAISKGDMVSTCSGALIDDYHVLTAAHCIYENNPGHRDFGWVDNVFVHAGRDFEVGVVNDAGDDRDIRPFGEARATNMVVTTGWQSGFFTPLTSLREDLGLLTLDRNLGQFTGTLGYGTVGPSNFIDKAVEYFPYSDVLGKILSPVTTVVDAVVPFVTEVSVAHYPAEQGYDGDMQYVSTGNTLSATGDFFFINKADVWTTGGSSGAPYLLGNFKHRDTPDMIVGLVKGGQRVTPGQGSIGFTGAGYATRLNDSWIDFIEDVLNDDPRPTDRSALVDHDKWFDTNDASHSLARGHVNEEITLRTKVFNAGTAAANNVEVKFSLSPRGFGCFAV